MGESVTHSWTLSMWTNYLSAFLHISPLWRINSISTLLQQLGKIIPSSSVIMETAIHSSAMLVELHHKKLYRVVWCDGWVISELLLLCNCDSLFKFSIRLIRDSCNFNYLLIINYSIDCFALSDSLVWTHSQKSCDHSIPSCRHHDQLITSEYGSRNYGNFQDFVGDWQWCKGAKGGYYDLEFARQKRSKRDSTLLYRYIKEGPSVACMRSPADCKHEVQARKTMTNYISIQQWSSPEEACLHGALTEKLNFLHVS